MINKITLTITEEMATVFGLSSFVPGKNENITPINRNKACRAEFKVSNLYQTQIKTAVVGVYKISICLNTTV